MMNSYFEQSGFYGGHGQTGAEQAYRFPLGLGVNPYGPASTGPRQDTYDAAAAAAAASCKLYEQQYKLDCVKDQSGYGTATIKSDNQAISSWAAAAAAAAAAAQQGVGVDRSSTVGGVHNGSSGGVVNRGYGVSSNPPEGAIAPVAPRSAPIVNNNPWSPCSINTATATAVPIPQQQQQHTQHTSVVQQQHQQQQQQQHQQQLVQQQQLHTPTGQQQQHAISQQQSPQSQSSAHTFYPWMAIAGKFVSSHNDTLNVLLSKASALLYISVTSLKVSSKGGS